MTALAFMEQTSMMVTVFVTIIIFMFGRVGTAMLLLAVWFVAVTVIALVNG